MLIILLSHIPLPLPIWRPHFGSSEVLHLSLRRVGNLQLKRMTRLRETFPSLSPPSNQHPKNTDGIDHG